MVAVDGFMLSVALLVVVMSLVLVGISGWAGPFVAGTFRLERNPERWAVVYRRVGAAGIALGAFMLLLALLG